MEDYQYDLEHLNNDEEKIRYVNNPWGNLSAQLQGAVGHFLYREHNSVEFVKYMTDMLGRDFVDADLVQRWLEYHSSTRSRDAADIEMVTLINSINLPKSGV